MSPMRYAWDFMFAAVVVAPLFSYTDTYPSIASALELDDSGAYTRVTKVQLDAFLSGQTAGAAEAGSTSSTSTDSTTDATSIPSQVTP